MLLRKLEALLEQHKRKLDWQPCEALLGGWPNLDSHQEDAI